MHKSVGTGIEATMMAWKLYFNEDYIVFLVISLGGLPVYMCITESSI